MNTIAPLLMGLGILLLFVEFKTPGFGIFGISGLILLGIFFASHYIAGLAGNEPVFFFVLGIVLIAVELFVLPGSMIFALSGIVLVLGSLLWTMIDYWPSQSDGESDSIGFTITPEMLTKPLLQFGLGILITFAGALLVARFLKGSWIERQLVLESAAGGDSKTIRKERDSKLPSPGSKGVSLTPLHPGGRVEIAGQRYEARCAVGSIQRDKQIRVVNSSDFDLIVEEVNS